MQKNAGATLAFFLCQNSNIFKGFSFGKEKVKLYLKFREEYCYFYSSYQFAIKMIRFQSKI